MNPMEQWLTAMPPAKLSITISPDFIKLHKIQDECLMALVFNYPDGLLHEMYKHSFPSERNTIAGLVRTNAKCNLDGNSNIVIKN